MVYCTSEHTARTEYVVPNTLEVLQDAGSYEEYIVGQVTRNPIPVNTPTQCSPSAKLTCIAQAVCTGYTYEDYRIIMDTDEDYRVITKEDLQGLTTGPTGEADQVWQGKGLHGMPS